MFPKQRAAEHALTFLSDGMVIGLGTGTTAVSAGFGSRDSGGPTEKRSRCADITSVNSGQFNWGFRWLIWEPTARLISLWMLPMRSILIWTLSKGLGGALSRRDVAQNSRRLIIIADSSKLVDRLGNQSPLPVEVLPFCHQTHEKFLRSLGATPVSAWCG